MFEDDVLGMEEAGEDALFKVSDEWRALNKREFLEGDPELTTKQQWVLEAHDMYRRLYDD